MKMSRETAEAFGVAFAMWAYDNGAVFPCGADTGVRGGVSKRHIAIDAVAVEESDTYAAWCEEIAPDTGVDIYETSEMYRIMRDRMIEELKKIREHAAKVM